MTAAPLVGLDGSRRKHPASAMASMSPKCTSVQDTEASGSPPSPPSPSPFRLPSPGTWVAAKEPKAATSIWEPLNPPGSGSWKAAKPPPSCAAPSWMSLGDLRLRAMTWGADQRRPSLELVTNSPKSFPIEEKTPTVMRPDASSVMS